MVFQKRKQLLVVEDNEINRAILCEILSGQYQVLEAENGQAALDVLREQKGRVALILLDVMMPVMDGYTFLDRIREDEQLSLIPVIVMTQSETEADEVAALSHGATDFVPKPYRPQVILHRVASLIKLRETAAMVNQVQYDRLTGLYSKEFFYQKVRERLDEYPDEEFTIVSSNIENFKLYNDTFGRAAGDRLLRDIARILIGHTGETAICGRYSADRFLFLQERSWEQAEREVFFRTTHMGAPGNFHSISMKWGLYEVTDRSLSVEQMCDRALLAADSIKGQYNQPFAIYDDALRGRLLREKAIIDAMEPALAQGQFTVYLQPKYSLSDQCLAGAEALVRWNHPEWGLISPGEFIPLFEQNGFIPSLDRCIWAQVCALLQRWREQGYPLLPVSVNVSRADIYQPDFADKLLELTRKYGVEPAQLHLEITESAYTENSAQILQTVEQLRRLGFVIEMDDFGSGYSSLHMLSRMKLDILKLDLRFVQNELSIPPEQSILNDVITMAHRMGLTVVAEGVETREQMKRLKSVACDYVQGYYFGKPMPSGEFEALLQCSRCQVMSPLPAPPQPDSTVRTLLIAEEVSAYLGKLRKTFEGQYRLLEAADGEQALALLEREAGVSGVILSLTLPGGGAELLLKAMSQNPAYWDIPVLAMAPSGEAADELPLTLSADDFLCKCHPQRDVRRRVERLLSAADSHRQKASLLDDVNRDFLTGLLNRRGLHSAMAALRKEDLPLAVCLFDVHGLADINSTHGHEMGNRIVQSFADLLRRKTRAEDIQCRYSGDEFLVVLRRVKDGDTALSKGNDICRAFLENPMAAQFSFSCSGGIVLCTPEETPSVALLERADLALTQAKQKNRGACCLWTE